MKTQKPKSITTDTRLTNSNFFSASGLDKTILHAEGSEQPERNFLSHQIRNSESREVQFLRHKNAQLEERVRRLNHHVGKLEQDKTHLLDLNQQYVSVVNRYYQKPEKKGKNKPEEMKVLQQLEKDHRNLVKHCLTMEAEIKNYMKDLDEYEQHKKQLRKANHTCVEELVKEMLDLTADSRELKKQNNKLSFQLEKSRRQCQLLKKVRGDQEKEAGSSEEQISKMRSLINTVKQESLDRANSYEAKIYELDLKVEKLESQLRKQQQTATRSTINKRNLQMREVEHIHERDYLQKSLNQFKEPRGRSVGSRISANCSVSKVLSKQLKGRKGAIGKVPIF